MNQGISQALNACYCLLFVKHQVKLISAGKEVVNVSILDGICVLVNNISSSEIITIIIICENGKL